MHYKEFYYLKADLRGGTVGDKVRVHDWNDIEVEVSINGELIWIPASLFNTFFTDDPNKIQNRVDLNGHRFYI